MRPLFRNSNNSNKNSRNPLRVDKILCRVPSHESNISDLSASLAPNLPRGPAVGAMGPNVGTGGLHSLSNPNHLGHPNYNPTFPHGVTSKSTARASDNNFVYSFLHECGVLENVNDLLTVVNGSVSSTQRGVAHGNSYCNNTHTSKKGGCVSGCLYDRPAVWGMAPDEDGEDDTTEQETVSSKLDFPNEMDRSVEYDNVELVLDESAPLPTFSADTPQSTQSSSRRMLPNMRGHPPSIGQNGRKSPGTGILKNKLGKLNRKTPSPTMANSNSVAGSTPSVGFSNSLGGIGGVNVVESRNDPRISHMYDIAGFDNEEMRPSLAAQRSRSGSKGGSRGATPTSMNSRGVSPVPDTFNVGSTKSVSAGVERGVEKAKEEMFCQPVGDVNAKSAVGQMGIVEVGGGEFRSVGGGIESGADTVPAGNSQSEASNIPSKVQLAMDASTGVFPMNEEVEVDNAPFLKEPEPIPEKKASRGGKILKGLSFKPKSAKNPKSTKDARIRIRSISPKKRSRSLGRRGKKNAANAKDIALSPAQIEDAKKWKATYDKNSDKTYYYHRESKVVRWEKPLGFDEATREKENEDNAGKVVAPSTLLNNKRNLGRKGGLKSSRVEKRSAAVAAAAAGRLNSAGAADPTKEDADAKREDLQNESSKDEATYWRATLDATTGKTYYYNKKTKEVSWVAPPCLDDGGKDASKNTKVEDTAAMSSVAEKRKKTWFKPKKAEKEAAEQDDNENQAPVEEVKQAVPEKKAVTKEVEQDDNVDAAVAAEKDEFAKYWRATLDASTGKTYYFNKKTKLVTWVKPEGFKEKEPSDKKKEKLAAVEEETTVDVVDKEEIKAATETVAVPEPDTGAVDDEEIADDQMEDMSEIEGFTDTETLECESINNKTTTQASVKKKQDAPFDEPDAPFDEPYDEPKSSSSSKRAHFKPLPPNNDDDEEGNEQEDSFDFSENYNKVGAGVPLYGRVVSKSLKSIDFDGTSRQRTYTSHATEETKQAGNLAGRSTSNGNNISKLDDSLTLESTSLNNSSIDCSEIFAPFSTDAPKNAAEETTRRSTRGNGQPSTKNECYKSSRRGRPIKPPSGTTTTRDKLRDRLPQLPATPPRRSSQRNSNNHRSSRNTSANNNNNSKKSSSGNKHYSKRADNLRGSSAEDETSYEDEGEETEVEESDWMESDDDVSALSGIGNDAPEDKKKRRGRMGLVAGGMRGGGRKGSEKQPQGHNQGDKGHHKNSRNPRSEKSRGKDTQQKQPSQKSSDKKEWSQQELDSFIAKNDWGSVSEYINEMRINKNNNKNTSSSDDHNGANAVQKQPSVREIQQRIKYNRSTERESSLPKKRFGARSQMQHDEIPHSKEENSRASGDGAESESVWQSLSSASYDESSEVSSQYHQQQQRQLGRKSSRSSARRR